MNPLSYLNNADIDAFEGLYQQYKQDPQSVDPEWRNFFEGFEFSKTDYTQAPTKNPTESLPEDFVPEQFQKELAVSNLIGAYRQRGHMFAKTNPVRPRRKHDGPIDFENFGLSEADMDTEFHAGSRIGLGTVTLREIHQLLEQTYCGSIGVEYKFVRTLEIIDWLEKKMESCRNTPNFTYKEKIELLRKTNEAVAFESFLHTKFVGQKRFSLEGGESIIPALDTVVEYGAELGVEEFVIGMAHRGRLNVLANVLGKTYNDIFAEFEGKAFGSDGFAGDVKYHMGYSSDKIVRGGKKVHLSLTPNPSHLEAVNPVVEGISRAKIDQYHQGNVKKLVPILIHGDQSMAGQGIVYEVLQMSQLQGYGTGGTIHLVINNQVGFTADYVEGRSSTYCTDVAKTTLSPVFHVNADDIEAVVYVIKLALEFRQKFHRDVFVDILGYRRHGHNEADEPRFTQPDLYRRIARHPKVREVYIKKLVESGSLTEKETTQM
jgi:2-oxoglutarate dehydrogenase E1 component